MDDEKIMLVVTAKTISNRCFFKNAIMLDYTLQYIKAIDVIPGRFQKVIIGSNDYHTLLDDSWIKYTDEDEPSMIDYAHIHGTFAQRYHSAVCCFTRVCVNGSQHRNACSGGLLCRICLSPTHLTNYGNIGVKT